MSEITDETLMAWADRELAPADSSRIDGQIARDETLRDRAEAFVATRRSIEAAFQSGLTEPIPARLLALLEEPKGHKLRPQAQPEHARAEHAGAERAVARKHSASPRVRLALPQWLLWAPGLAVAGLAGFIIGQAGQGPAVRGTGAQTVTVLAEGELARVLETSAMIPSAESTPGAGTIRPVNTFMTRSGGYCRQYEITAAGSAAAGVACRAQGGWEIIAHVPTPVQAPDPTRTTPAGHAEPPAVTELVDHLIAGDVLGLADEKTAIAKGWRR